MVKNEKKSLLEMLKVNYVDIGVATKQGRIYLLIIPGLVYTKGEIYLKLQGELYDLNFMKIK